MTIQPSNSDESNKPHKIVPQINRQFLLAWSVGVPISYSMLGFLSNFYRSKSEFILISLVIHSIATLAALFLMTRMKRVFQSRPTDIAIYVILAGGLIAFLISLVNMESKSPWLFNPPIYRIGPELLIYFFAGIALAFPASSWVFSIAERMNLKPTRIISFVDDHLGGLLLATFFFLVYLLLASIFNQPIFRYDDIFFDADTYFWRTRFATEDYRDLTMRPVHPFVIMIVRPLIALIAVLLKGNSLYAAFVLVALTGALCVFLVWYFVKYVTGNSPYAILIACLFGASASQLVFGSFIETYVFLAATALIFVVLLLKDKPQYALVIAGLTAFGINFSNFGQTMLAHLLVKRDIRQLIKYGLIVAALVVPLSLLNNSIYPGDEPYFWDLSAYGNEGKFFFPETFQRANYLGRVMFLHSTVAPEPFFTDEGRELLKVWMFRASIRKAPMRIAEYVGWFESTVAFLWLAFLLLGGVLFLKNLLRRDNGFSFTFILTMAFYFMLHLRYGKDVFLYSANWTYAIILFLALAWQELSGKRWFQAALLGFILLLLVNNLRLISYMLTTPFLYPSSR